MLDEHAKKFKMNRSHLIEMIVIEYFEKLQYIFVALEITILFLT